MNDDRSYEETGAGRIVLMAVLLAGTVTLLSFLLDDPSGDGPAVQPTLSAQAAEPAATRRDDSAGPLVARSPSDQTWAADESSRGLRPDASH